MFRFQTVRGRAHIDLRNSTILRGAPEDMPLHRVNSDVFHPGAVAVVDSSTHPHAILSDAKHPQLIVHRSRGEASIIGCRHKRDSENVAEVPRLDARLHSVARTTTL